MAADQLLHSIGHSTPSEEWFDFDNFDIPYEGLGSNPTTSIDSISPKDLDLTFADFDDCNWGPAPAVCGQDLFADIVNYDAPCEGYVGHAFDASQPMLDPTGAFHPPPPPPNQGLIGSQLCDPWAQDIGDADDQFYSSIRQMVELQAAADPAALSIKEKRMEASIALHLQRLQKAALQDLELSSISSTTFPSPRWSESAGSVSQSGTCATPVTSPSEMARTPASGPDPAVGGMELVLDLNMNTTTNLPKKQKPRSQAQKENYIKARKYGACEKHRKQHKRCNCLEKAAALAVSQQAVSTAEMAAKSIVNAQLHVHRSGKEQLLMRTIPASARKSPVSQPTGGLVPREDQSVQLRHPSRVSSTNFTMDPRYGHHSPRSAEPVASCRRAVGCPNTGQPAPPRSPVSCRSADLVHSTPGRLQPSSTSSQPDQKSHAAIHGPRHVQASGRLRTVQTVSTRWRASVQTSVLFKPNASDDAVASSTTRASVHTPVVRPRPSANHGERGSRTISDACKHVWSPGLGVQATSSRHVSTHRSLDVPANDVHDQSVSRTVVSRVLQSVFPVSGFLDLSIFVASRLSSWLGRSGVFSRFGKSVMISSKKHWLTGKGLGWC